jgi:IS605 OrfB family transposase
MPFFRLTDSINTTKIPPVKLTLQIQLLPDAEQANALLATVERFNEAADWLAGNAFDAKMANKVELQKLHYRELRERFGLSAQHAIRCIAQVCECYKRDKSKRPRFRPHAAVPYDQRIMSFKGIDRVSLLTLTGRVVVPFVAGQYQHDRFGFAKGQADLVRRKDGKWFLLVTVDLPDGTPIHATDFVGVDLGVTQLATTSDGDHFGGGKVESVRQKFHGTRKRLQKAAAKRQNKGRRPKSIRRRLKRIGSRESRFRRDHNHVISKKLVALAKGTGRGIALEELSGIRDRTRFRKGQRAKMGGWAFHQLRSFITYKGKLHGVPVVLVDPRNTSRTCIACGHCDKANRRSQAIFRCVRCGHTANADVNGARNILAKALVNVPHVSEPPRAPAVA